LVIPVKVLGDQDSISTNELQVRLPEEPGLFGEDKARCVSVDTKTAPGGRKKKEVFRKKKNWRNSDVSTMKISCCKSR